MEVSRTQLDVLKAMANGKKLIKSTTVDGGCYIDWKRIRYTTLFALWKNGLIKSKKGHDFPTEEYILTEKGKEALIEELQKFTEVKVKDNLNRILEAK